MAKKIGIIVLLCFSLCVGGVSAFANEGHDETDTQTLIETQPPVSSVLFRQDGADIQQSTDEGKTWQSYSPIEETDYFTYSVSAPSFIRKKVLTMNEEWSNDACRGYVIKAMENCGFHAKDIHQVLVELYEVFDFCAVEEAAHYYENWQY